ncbi:two-component response regulator ARR14-like isoform X2 [Tripterygium wilfordii]|nr:two-component response regulator ARR14-like isoform X2 [Tripterygium wilfordii]
MLGLKVSGEAEELCTLLNSERHVDACITTDSNDFLFGATCVLNASGLIPSEGSVVVDLSENDAQSYTSLSVLVVDCDTECLTIVSDMLRRFEYKVITAKRAADALCIVRETENELDLILTETHLPDMKMYEFLEALGQMSNLPIVVMSAENDSKAILGSYHKGAVFYLVKPLMMNDVKNLWQFAYISKTERMMSMEGLSGFSQESQHGDSEARESIVTMEKQVLLCAKGHEQEEMYKEGKEDNFEVLKESRIIWTDELHEKFLQAVKEQGVQNARPKNILEHMNVQGLKKEQVSSHLQKYRIKLRKKQEFAQNTMKNFNGLMYMPSLGSIYLTNRVDTGPNRVPNFLQRQSTLQNSFPGFSRPDSGQFGFRNFVIGELPHSKKMKNHVGDSGFSVTYHPKLFNDTIRGQQEELVLMPQLSSVPPPAR